MSEAVNLSDDFTTRSKSEKERRQIDRETKERFENDYLLIALRCGC